MTSKKPGRRLSSGPQTALETALNEMTEHLGHEKNGPVRNQTRNVAHPSRHDPEVS